MPGIMQGSTKSYNTRRVATRLNDLQASVVIPTFGRG
jgi:hypothetical protein